VWRGRCYPFVLLATDAQSLPVKCLALDAERNNGSLAATGLSRPLPRTKTQCDVLRCKVSRFEVLRRCPASSVARTVCPSSPASPTNDMTRRRCVVVTFFARRRPKTGVSRRRLPRCAPIGLEVVQKGSCQMHDIDATRVTQDFTHACSGQLWRSGTGFGFFTASITFRILSGGKEEPCWRPA
jgi:hypothetical protein